MKGGKETLNKDLLLMTPGPVFIDSDILHEGARPLLHHRTKDFAPIYSDVVDRLKRIFKTKGELFLLHSSGTGGMEAAIANLFNEGEKVLTVETGAFGERFTQIAQAFKLNVITLKYPWGKGAKIEDIAQMLRQHPDIRGIAITFNETSTGVHNKIELVGKLTKDKDILLITDGVSGIGALPFDMDGWHIDCAISASQKGFLSPPGVGMIALSSKAMNKLQNVKCHGFYFDLKYYIKNQRLDIPSYPWTPPISVMYCLQKALQRIEEVGLDKMIKHYEHLANALRQAIEGIGLTIFTEEGYRSNVLTVINSPTGIHPSIIVEQMRNRYGILIASGQGEIADKVFRITTIGTIGEKEILSTIALLEIVLLKAGFLKELGKGVKIAQEYFASLQ